MINHALKMQSLINQYSLMQLTIATIATLMFVLITYAFAIPMINRIKIIAIINEKDPLTQKQHECRVVPRSKSFCKKKMKKIIADFSII